MKVGSVALAVLLAMLAVASSPDQQAGADAVSAPPSVKVISALTLKDENGFDYLAMPKERRRLVATFTLTNASPSSELPSQDLYGIQMRLTFTGLKLDGEVAGLTRDAQATTAVWTIQQLKAGKSASMVLTGKTTTGGEKIFAIESLGTQTTPIARITKLAPATGHLTLEAPKGGKLRSFTKRTFKGTVAAATCDRAGRGRVRLTGEYPVGRTPPYKLMRKQVPGHARFVQARTGVKGVCPFEAAVKFKRLSDYRGRTFSFWARSNRGGRSDKVSVKVARRP